MKGSGAPTMKDVAREAGVSLATVSKVINGIRVGDGCRRRVEQAAERLGYRVNNYARGLKTNRTGCVAMVLPSLRHPFFAALADETIACLGQRGYRCILMITNFDAKAEQESLVLVRQNKADGVIALTYSRNLEPDPELPMVAIDRPLGEGIPCVASNNYAGGSLAAQRLLELGCKRPVVFHVASRVPAEPQKRVSGFLDVCRSRNAPCEAVVVPSTEGEAPFFRFLEERIRDAAQEYGGLFCTTDRLTVLVRQFLGARGIRAPEDVQLIGYDGVSHYATGAYDCSTIVQPVREMSETAVELLLDESRRARGGLICLPVRYAPGGTTRDDG